MTTPRNNPKPRARYKQRVKAFSPTHDYIKEAIREFQARGGKIVKLPPIEKPEMLAFQLFDTEK
jgi:hypothetical protein